MKRFVCEACGKNYASSSTETEEEAARKEYERLYERPFNPNEAAMICEDCHKIALQLLWTGEFP